MIIQFNTDHNIHGRETLEAKFSTLITDGLERFSAHITRVEIHLSDENGRKGGVSDKRCILEARYQGMNPVAVTNDADNLDLAVKGAINKLKSALDHKLAHWNNH